MGSNDSTCCGSNTQNRLPCEPTATSLKEHRKIQQHHYNTSMRQTQTSNTIINVVNPPNQPDVSGPADISKLKWFANGSNIYQYKYIHNQPSQPQPTNNNNNVSFKGNNDDLFAINQVTQMNCGKRSTHSNW
eukprot:804604_1